VFNYVVVVPGSYDYHCDNHFPSGMTGSFNATATDVDNRQSLPGVFRLEQNYPNPFNPTTEIQFTIGNRQLTTVDVFDVTGSVVATLVNGVKEPGTYTVRFDGRDLASGVYLYRLRAGDFEATRKFLLLR